MGADAECQVFRQFELPIAQSDLGADHVDCGWWKVRSCSDRFGERREGSDASASRERFERLAKCRLDEVVEPESAYQCQRAIPVFTAEAVIDRFANLTFGEWSFRQLLKEKFAEQRMKVGPLVAGHETEISGMEDQFVEVDAEVFFNRASGHIGQQCEGG